MFNRKNQSLAIVTALVALVSTTCASYAQKTWTYSNWLPATHPIHTDVFLPWAADVERVTEGRVKIRVAPKIVGTPQAQFDVVRDRLADASIMVPGYTPGRFDITTLGEAPFLTDRADVGAVAFSRFFEKYIAPLNVFRGVHVASAFVTSPGQILSKKPIRSIEDLKGLKLRSPLIGTISTIDALGAVPVQKNAAESYEMLSSGALDGALSGVEQAKSYRLAEVVSNLTIVPGALYNSVLMLVINQDAWNELSEEDRKAISAVSGEAFARNIGKTVSVADKGGIEAVKAAKGTVERASAELTAQIHKALAGQEQKLIAKAEQLGLKDAAGALADYRSMIAELEKEAAER